MLIVGDGVAARMAEAIARARSDDDVVSVIELAPQDIGGFDTSALGPATSETAIFPAIGPSALNFARFDLWAKLKLAGFRIGTLIHPAARCDASARFAEGVMVCAGATVDAGAYVGKGTIIGSGSLIGIDASVGAWCWLSTGVKIGPQASVGSHVVLGSGMVLADRAKVGDTCEIDTGTVCRGEYPTGTFISPEFPLPGAHLMRASREA
jgi:UDP-3-O-[3-hydroxymyristoyl] glucosamine N-acyltransferase